MALEPGYQLGRYKVIRQLGRGGMGEVYLAEDTRLERTVALKVLPEDVSDNHQRLSRFAREARTASSLNHPNVAHIYEIEVTESPRYIAMEYIKGETLRQRLASSQIKLNEAIDIAVQITRAVAAAHAAGIVHRDIKTENIMISHDGYVKVLDFGLAKLIEPSDDYPDPAAKTVTSAQTDPGVLMGTFNYMSPEQARGLPADARSDLWSLGVVIYEMVAGAAPFVGRTPSDLLSSILKDNPPPLARFNRDVPDQLEWIVEKALTKELEGRYQTATELLTDLQRLKNRLGAEAEMERSSLADFRVSRSSMPRASQSAFDVNRTSSASAELTKSVHSQSNAGQAVSSFKSHKKVIIIAASLFVVLIGAGLIFFLRGKSTAQSSVTPPRPLQRITSESGLQIGVTWSPDARLIAYSSNRSGNFDIWFQPVGGGGDAVQVTHSPALDWQPDWSPDGNSIVFRSERDGGGLYIIPFPTGNERKVAPFGYRPRWSPDGSKILFLGQGQRLFDFPKMYYVTLGDETPHEIAPLSNTEEGIKGSAVAWHPDGKRVSFLSVDGVFWTVPLAGGEPVKSTLTPKVEGQMKEANVELGNFCWSRSGKYLYFEGTSRTVTNLWRVTVDPETLSWIDGPERISNGPGPDADISLSADGKRLAYTTTTQSTRIWLLPFDSVTAQLKGQGQPVTDQGMQALFSDLSPDGNKLAFISHLPGVGRQELRVKFLKDNQEKVLLDDNTFNYYPRWSPDSMRIAFSRFRPLNQQSSSEDFAPQGTAKAGPIAMLDTRTGGVQFITTQGPWLDYVYDWSPDGQWLLASSNRQMPERWQICLFPLAEAPHAETGMRVVASDPDNCLWTPRFSPDGRWIAYVLQKPVGATDSVLCVVPATGGEPIRLTNQGTWCDWPRWSMDGKTLYFVSNYNSSFLNVYGIHFDPTVGKALGEPFQVTSFESPAQLISPRLVMVEMSLSKNRLALPITDVSGNIWMQENVDR
ncbi:MAG TPA: protein kinase [Pyrinomonadaceae bacterium]